MALINTILSGNTSSTSTFDSGTIPADGDQILNLGGFNITFDQDITIGPSAASGQFPGGSGTTAPSAAFFSRGQCEIRIKADVTVRAKGDFLIHGGKLVMEQGSTLILDTTSNPDAALGFYILDIAAEYGEDISRVKLVTEGIELSPCEIRKEGSGSAWLDAGSSRSSSGTPKRGSGGCNCQYTVFRNLGVMPHQYVAADWNNSAFISALNWSYYKIHAGINIDLRTDSQNTNYINQVEHVWNHCVFDGVTGINSYYAAGAAASFKNVELTYCRTKNTPWWLRGYSWIRSATSKVWSDGSDLDNGTADGPAYKHAANVGTRKLIGNTFDRELHFSDGAPGWVFQDNALLDGIYILNVGTWLRGPDIFRGNLIVRSDQWTIPGQPFPEYQMPATWFANANPAIHSHYGVQAMEDTQSYRVDYMNIPYGTGKRDPNVPAAISANVGSWVEGNYFMEDSDRDNPHYLQPKYGDGNGVHVFKDNIFEGVRVSGDGEFLRLSYFFDVARTTPTYDTAACLVIGTLCLPTASFGTGGSLNHIIETTYPSGHPNAGQNVLGSTYVYDAKVLGDGTYFGGYIPHIYTNNTLYLGAGEGALNVSEAGFHYDVVRYCKNNIFWDVEKRTGVGVPWCIGDVSIKSHPDLIIPENVDYNIKINAPGVTDTTLTGNFTEDTTAGSGHNSAKSHLNFNSNGYSGLELSNPDALLGGVKRINAFGLNDIELVVSDNADLPLVNYKVNAGFYSFSKTGIQSGTRSWQMIAKQYDYDDPDQSPDWTIQGLFDFVRGSAAPVRTNQVFNSVLDSYQTYTDPALSTNPLGDHGFLNYVDNHMLNDVLKNLTASYPHPGALPFSDPNTPPTATDDPFSINIDGTLNLTFDQLLSNDSDADPQDTSLFVGAISQPSNGVVTVNSTARTVVYQPNSGFFGTDTFTYVLQDARGGEATGSVIVTVVNQPPTVDGKAYSGESNTALIIDKPDLLVGAVDPEGKGVSFHSVGQPANGSVTDTGDKVVYQPDTDYVGIDSFTYQIIDDDGIIGSSTVTIVVNAGKGIISVLTQEERDQLKNALKLSDFIALG